MSLDQAVAICKKLVPQVDKTNPLYTGVLDANLNGVPCEVADLQLAGMFVDPTPAPPRARNCDEVGRTNILRGDPDYAPWLDRDNDGVACEPWYGGTTSSVYGLTGGDGPNCSEVGRTDIPIGDPQYAAKLDADNDGIGCESNGNDGAYASTGLTRGLPATGE